MNRPPLHRLTSRLGANGRRMIVVLVIVAAGVLLVAPATAGARVAKSHKAQFWRSLSG
jgi:hypothetical protein